ncbi:polyamine aminopropyltransferase [Arhodomonas sp. AD133]|uniref:polyamine aminopropyltransferase n=1 Tax=Arhodomonas sp. AD133 TaxID=3415009 RepID=UPI003EB71A41
MAVRRLRDVYLIVATGLLAGCGLVYEYLMAAYAGRVLGALETVVFAMIGLMILAMGIGAFAARCFRRPLTAFAVLELAIAFVGGGAVLAIAAVNALAYLAPVWFADFLGLPDGVDLRGGAMAALESLAGVLPYAIGALLGMLVGMEIPLIARIREQLHGHALSHNAGTVYGADYIGAGVAAGVWIGGMMLLPAPVAAALTAGVNLLVGVGFLVLFARWLGRRTVVLAVGHAAVAAMAVWVGVNGQDLEARLEDMLYLDQVVYSKNTAVQRFTVTRRYVGPERAPVYTLYLNGRTQFASVDEYIYHDLLVHPALAASARQERVLVVGGGDGLALREILKWDPQSVTLVDLDPELVEFFSEPVRAGAEVVNAPLLALNEHSFNDPRVKTRFGDAYLIVDELIAAGRRFDAIVVDLPDPYHPDLNRLYASRFYAKLRHLLAGDGALAVQSTSPYHSRSAFMSIGRTLEHAGFAHVEPYHANVPTFGEWGWHLAVPRGRPGSARVAEHERLPVETRWAEPATIAAAFAFPGDFFAGRDDILINRLGNYAAYRYHQRAWEEGALLPETHAVAQAPPAEIP